MKHLFVPFLAAVVCSSAAYAQEAPTPLVATVSPQPSKVLPANTEISVSMNDTVTTKGKRWNEGDTFDLTVTHNVMLDEYIVIPKGSRAVGRITWLTSKGAFGKSGKMEIDIEYVEVSGRRIPLVGHYRQEGEGNTVATVGGVVLAGVFAGFVTGKSGVIPQGRELVAHTKEDLPVAFAARPPVAPAPLVAQPAQQPTPAPVPAAAKNDGSAPTVVNF